MCAIPGSAPPAASRERRWREHCWTRADSESVRIESTPGMLSDHYDPQSKTLRLSPEVYYTPSLAAAGIAAHETGHALQDAAPIPTVARWRRAVAARAWSVITCRWRWKPSIT
ncbi:MAG: hypothetical protein EHM67_18870 [Hyphomicrobiaceae bacterium]|nr:MAG: hypothetical protein EHM67_18870 [Hyphomicrobiaceae bacterium]